MITRPCVKCGTPCRGPRGVKYIKLQLCRACRRAWRQEQIRLAVQRWRKRNGPAVQALRRAMGAA